MYNDNDFRAALASPAFAYTRVRNIAGSAVVFAYHNDTKSPTGVRLAYAHDFDKALPIMDAMGKAFPLSPTEGLQGGR